MLGGTCCIAVGDYEYNPADLTRQMLLSALSKVQQYGDGRIGVVVGPAITDDATEDAEEIVIADAKLIAII